MTMPMVAACAEGLSVHVVLRVCFSQRFTVRAGAVLLCVLESAEAARSQGVQSGALQRSMKKRKAREQEVELVDPSREEAVAGVDAFSTQARISVGRGEDVRLTKDLLRSTGLGGSCVDALGALVRHRSVVQVRVLGRRCGVG